MRIVQFTAENIKKIKAVSIKPDGSMVVIAGANGQGKSSILDAIFMALGGTKAIPSQPVRHGEEKAFVRLDLGEIIVTRKFTAGGGTSLHVEAANGAKFPTPQRMLDELLGALTFDPLEFTRATPKQQLETLKSLVKLEIDIDALELDNQSDYLTRTEFNKHVKQLEGELAGIHVPEGTPDELVDVGDLIGKLTDAGNANVERMKELSRRVDISNRAAGKRADASANRKKADELLELAALQDAEARTLLDGLDAAVAIPEAVNTESLKLQIDGARNANMFIQEKARRFALRGKLNAARSNAEDITSRMDKRNSEKRAAIASAQMPVDGLTFGDGEVIFQGVPLAQASGAEQLRISVAIAMAANPKLRILRIKDGSLLDENGLQLLEFLAETNDFQVWLEKVDTSGKVGIIIEDGKVVSDEKTA